MYVWLSQGIFLVGLGSTDDPACDGPASEKRLFILQRVCQAAQKKKKKKKKET
jgi:hypothetical protein